MQVGCQNTITSPNIIFDSTTDTFIEYIGIGITGYNDKILKGVSLDSCKQACLTELSFICLSIDYDRVKNDCYLSSINKDTINLTTWNDYSHYHRSMYSLKA